MEAGRQVLAIQPIIIVLRFPLQIASVTTTQTPEVTFSSTVTVPATFHTLEETTSRRDPTLTTNGPTNKRKQPQRKGDIAFRVSRLHAQFVMTTFISFS